MFCFLCIAKAKVSIPNAYQRLNPRPLNLKATVNGKALKFNRDYKFSKVDVKSAPWERTDEENHK